ncbi:MAG: hypothetical protein AAF235_08430 [Planctomycetota bacterium]
MLFNIITLGIVLLVAYFWSNYGLFSALLHLVCTVVAGAVAFGLWEPIAYAALGAIPESGGAAVLESVVWALSLLLPFGILLAVLRAVVDAAVPDGIKLPGAIDPAGGALVGGVSAYIAVGVLAIGLGFVRMNGVLGYKPVDVVPNGSVVRGGSMWIQADRFAAGLFGHLSETTLRSGDPLGVMYPDLDLAGYSLQLSHGEGASRNVIRPDDFSISSSYTLGPAAGDTAAALLAYPADMGGAQNRFDVNGDSVARGRVHGFMIEFGAGARESFGQVTLTGGQARLIAVADGGGESVAVYPHAIVSQGEGDDAAGLQRWRLDSRGVIISSLGGATATVNMGLEFFVPAGYSPSYLMLKNTRKQLDGLEPNAYDEPIGLEAAIAAGAFGGATRTIDDIDTETAQTVAAPTRDRRGRSTGSDSGVRIEDSLGFAVQKTQIGGLDINGANEVVRGQNTFLNDNLTGQAASINRDLRVEKFFVASGTKLVKVDVSPSQPASILGRSYRTAQGVVPPQLIDSRGTPYQAIGYIYADEDVTEVVIDPGQPIRGLAQLPTLSTARDDQTLTLLFSVSVGSEITTYALGNKAVLSFDPGLTVE